MDFSILRVRCICTVYAPLRVDMMLSTKVLLSDIGKLLALLLYYEERGVSQVG
ncbi:hypothetical protein ANAPRD1_00990 [Anaplasma phagocytophilum]|nr:hypothetical protein ANAPH2_01474 [Anaplasma phagocytophilum]SCV66091.1 hypothetical protein ANAPRD1_00990 [Anaplasma phagocytophilum]